MNRPVRSHLAWRVHLLAFDFPLPCLSGSVVSAHPSSVRAAIPAAPMATYDWGYAR
ncbi:hypothetical protein HNP46_005052 [Pseudomonas nitritireducens]|uniref:Uncharacterized protein n=1 Tax=Pseudomonas nitroreducens TaxID=46680 RepID=A0A7W7KNP3_PSENT|nr:hypothetical protein [Pseudomonas nitritireducens]MBB4866147.1 hypothetical protein [Pseudomonas nitritireducens]